MTMNIPGPPVIANVQRPDEGGLSLRLNQRVMAEVLQVSGDNVTLAIQGVRVVAKMASSEMAATLAERQTAQFVLREFSSDMIRLQLVPPDGQMTAPTNTRDLASQLLQRMNVDMDAQNLMIARALVAKGMMVDAATIQELRTALNGLTNWGENEVNLAATLKGAGLPLNAETLKLVLSAPNNLAEPMSELMAQMRSLLASNNLSPELRANLQATLDGLRGAILTWNGSAEEMESGLARMFQSLGRSVERDLAMVLARSSGDDEAAAGLMTRLGLLHQQLHAAGAHRAAESLERFMDSVRVMQYYNIPPENEPVGGQWARLELPMQAQGLAQNPPENLQEATLRVAYQKEGAARKVDPGYTRLIIQVDLAQGQTLEVDLSIVDRTISANLTATTDGLCGLAEDELPSFKEGLAAIGFNLQAARSEVGNPGKMTPGGASGDARKDDGILSVSV